MARPPAAGHPLRRGEVAHSTTEIHPREGSPGPLGEFRVCSGRRSLREEPAPGAPRATGRRTSVRRPRPHRGLALLIVIAAGPGCARQEAWIAPDPEVTVAAHRAADRLVLDRLPSGARGALEPPGWPHMPDEPSFVLHAGGEVRGGLWVVGRSRVLVRRDAAITSPRTAEVLSAWEEGALRLTLFQEGGATLGVDRFAREQGAEAAPLVRGAALRGTYRAAVRDASGAPLGWLRVRVESPAARVYDGVLPEATGDALAAAAALALDDEVEWIEEHPPDDTPPVR